MNIHVFKQKRFGIFSLLLFISVLANAQTGTIKGNVKTSDGKPAEFVIVNIKNVKSTVVNSKGEYTLNNINPGTYTIMASYIGLATKTDEVTVYANQTTNVNFMLAESGQTLNEVIVKGEKNKYKEDKVSQSLRLQTSLLETPQNIKVISKELIADQLVFDMVDGLTRNVSGATRSGHWDAQYANIQMRGASIPAFRNGMNMKMPWGPMSDDMSFVERIEFVKGPAGFMMSHGEPGGFYNVVTKKPTGLNQGSATVSAGSYNTLRTTIDLDGKLSKDDKLLYRINAMAQSKDTYNKFNFNNKYAIAPVISYKVDSNTTITAEYSHQHVEALALGTYGFSRNAIGDVPHSFLYSDPALPTYKINDHSAYLYITHRLNSNWELNAQFAYVNYTLSGAGVWPSSVDENGIMTRRINISDELAINKIGQVTLKGEVKTGNIVHRILGGLDKGHLNTWGDFSAPIGVSNDLKLNVYVAGVKTFVPFNIYAPQYGILLEDIPAFDRSRSLRERSGSNTYATDLSYTGLYLQDELRFFDEKLRLTLAGRYTNSVTLGKTNTADIKDNVVTPRVGISYSIDQQTSVYGLYDQSYLPTAGADFYGNTFEPVKGKDIEFGIKKEWFGGKWISSLTAYQITKENVLTADLVNVVGNWQVQVGEIRTKGIEFDLTGEIIPGLNATLNYAFTDPKITKDQARPGVVNKEGTYLSGTVKNIANGWLSYRFKKTGSALNGFGLSGGVQYQTDRFAGTLFTKPNFNDYIRFDAGASYQKGKVTFSGLVNNLLDRKLYTQGTIPSTPSNTSFYTWIYELPRNYRVSIAYKF